MKLAILADIHSNLKALSAILNDAREQGAAEVPSRRLGYGR